MKRVSFMRYPSDPCSSFKTYPSHDPSCLDKVNSPGFSPTSNPHGTTAIPPDTRPHHNRQLCGSPPPCSVRVPYLPKVPYCVPTHQPSSSTFVPALSRPSAPATGSALSSSRRANLPCQQLLTLARLHGTSRYLLPRRRCSCRRPPAACMMTCLPSSTKSPGCALSRTIS